MVPHSTKKVIGKTMSLRKRFLFRITMRRFRKKVTGKREGEIVRFGKKNGEQRVRDKGISETGNPLQNKCNQTAEKSIEEKKRLHDVPPSVVKAGFFKG